MWHNVLLAALALVASAVVTPMTRNAFVIAGVVDRPDDVRKLHSRHIPRVGGIAVFSAYFASLLVAVLMSRSEVSNMWWQIPGGWWLITATVTVFATGLFDDLNGLRPKQKLVGQLLAAAMAWQGGVQIHVLDGFYFSALLSFLLTVLWLLLCANAFNLIDGMDGLATGVSLFATLTVLASAVLSGNHLLVFVSAPLAGALLGFLWYNFNPASIFLGDCGSLTLGFLLGCFGSMWGHKTTTWFSMIAPTMAYSLPLVDTALSIVRRALTRRPIFTGDRGHIHHRLLDQGKSTREATVLLYGICILAALFSLAQQTLPNPYRSWLIVLFALVCYAGIKLLDYRELSIAKSIITTGSVFRQIDDQVRLNTLQKSLLTAGSIDEALSMIRCVCKDLGFEEVSMITSLKHHFTNDPTDCVIAIQITHNHALMLHGFSGVTRPIPVSQLSDLLVRHFDRTLLRQQSSADSAAAPPLLVEAINA